LPADGPPCIIDAPGFPIGLASSPYESHTVTLKAGDRLYLYSDGIPEAMDATDALYGTGRMLGELGRGRSTSLDRSVSDLLDDIRSWCDGADLRDDISLLAVEFGPAGGAAIGEPPATAIAAEVP
jgi:sigma-B regulation protein RsbU (phosphoserine phosphatase)